MSRPDDNDSNVRPSSEAPPRRPDFPQQGATANPPGGRPQWPAGSAAMRPTEPMPIQQPMPTGTVAAWSHTEQWQPPSRPEQRPPSRSEPWPAQRSTAPRPAPLRYVPTVGLGLRPRPRVGLRIVLALMLLAVATAAVFAIMPHPPAAVVELWESVSGTAGRMMDPVGAAESEAAVRGQQPARGPRIVPLNPETDQGVIAAPGAAEPAANPAAAAAAPPASAAARGALPAGNAAARGAALPANAAARGAVRPASPAAAAVAANSAGAAAALATMPGRGPAFAPTRDPAAARLAAGGPRRRWSRAARYRASLAAAAAAAAAAAPRGAPADPFDSAAANGAPAPRSAWPAARGASPAAPRDLASSGPQDAAGRGQPRAPILSAGDSEPASADPAAPPAPAPRPAAVTAPAAAPPAAPAPAAGHAADPSAPAGSLEDLMATAVRKPVRGKAEDSDKVAAAAAAIDKEPDPQDSARGKAAEASAAPVHSLTPSEIQASMKVIDRKVADCGREFSARGPAQLQVTALPDGSVGAVNVAGVFAGTPVGACLQRAVKTAVFPASRGLRFDYPLSLR